MFTKLHKPLDWFDGASELSHYNCIFLKICKVFLDILILCFKQQVSAEGFHSAAASFQKDETQSDVKHHGEIK